MRTIFFLLLSISSLAQTQYLVDSVGVTRAALLSVKLREVVDKSVRSDGFFTYTVESNVPGSSLPGNKARLLIYQVPMGITITDLQLRQIADYIKNITEPTTTQPLPDVVTTLGDAPGAQVIYTGNWTHGTNAPGWFNGTLSFTNIANDQVAINWNGYKLELIGELKNTHGKISVSMDGVEEIIDLYSPTDKLQQVLKTWVVPSGDHKLILKATGTKNALSSGTYLIWDYVKVYKKQP